MAQSAAAEAARRKDHRFATPSGALLEEPERKDIIDLRAEQVDALFKSVAPSVVAAAAGAVFLATVLIRLHVLAPGRGLAWAGYICICALTHLLLRWFYIHRRTATGIWPGWPVMFTAICLAEGAGWGWATTSLVADSQFDSKILIAAITIAISAGSIPCFCSYLPALLSFFLASTVPYTVISVTAINPMQQATSVMMFLYIGTEIVLGVSANRNFKALVSLRIQASDLAQGLKAQKEIAERASLAKSSFLAAASHDLRQPVHALGLLVGALRHVAMPSEGLRLIEQIEASTAAMDTLFSALLDISRLDAGVVDVHPQTFLIQPMLDRICLDHADEAREKGVALLSAPCGAVVYADPVLIERILRNLISNAVRYTERGRVLVGCRRGPELRVEVWDTGPGIAPSEQHRIFQEYYQLQNPERDRAKGLGLGLAIVRRLTDLLGIDLVLRSQLGYGSCFSVAIPSARLNAVAPRPSIDGSAGRPVRGLVMVIEDEIAVRDAMSALLSAWGHQVITAGSGEDILVEMAGSARRPDLIICDYRLQAGETGIEVIEAIRSEFNAPIPALLVTGDTVPDRLVEAKASGLLLLHKPVPNGRLRAAVANLMQTSEVAPLEEVR